LPPRTDRLGPRRGFRRESPRRGSGYIPVNARTVWDAGVTLGYCTDTNYDPKAGLDHELKLLNIMFSMRTSSK